MPPQAPWLAPSYIQPVMVGSLLDGPPTSSPLLNASVGLLEVGTGAVIGYLGSPAGGQRFLWSVAGGAAAGAFGALGILGLATVLLLKRR